MSKQKMEALSFRIAFSSKEVGYLPSIILIVGMKNSRDFLKRNKEIELRQILFRILINACIIYLKYGIRYEDNIL